MTPKLPSGSRRAQSSSAGFSGTSATPLTDLQLAAVSRAWWLGFAAYGLRPFPDSVEMIRTLRCTGLKLAILNNGSFGVDFWAEELEAFGLLRHMDAVLSSGDLTWRKPHPFLFQRALEVLGVSSEQALMVGDTPEADIEGALKLGISTVLKRGNDQVVRLSEADHSINGLSEFLSIVPRVPNSRVRDHRGLGQRRPAALAIVTRDVRVTGLERLLPPRTRR